MKKDDNKNEIIDEASQESFPTSDPPAWTLGTDNELNRYLKQGAQDLTHYIANDHLLTRNLIKLIRKTINSLEQKREINANELSMISDFLYIFLDKIHRQKAESLYPELQRKDQAKLTNYMLNNLREEHAEGRQLLQQLQNLTNQAQVLTEQNKQKLLNLLQEIEHLYHNHLAKEEEYILPFIKGAIPPALQAHFLKVFQEIEEKYQDKQQQIQNLIQD